MMWYFGPRRDPGLAFLAYFLLRQNVENGRRLVSPPCQHYSIEVDRATARKAWLDALDTNEWSGLCVGPPMAGKQTRNGSQTSDHSSTTLFNSLQRLSSGFRSHIGRPITNRSDMCECSTLWVTPVPAGQILLGRISRGLAGHDSQQVHFFYETGKLPVEETSSFQRRWESGEILTMRAIAKKG